MEPILLFIRIKKFQYLLKLKMEIKDVQEKIIVMKNNKNQFYHNEHNRELNQKFHNRKLKFYI
jgi:hypothetical protein